MTTRFPPFQTLLNERGLFVVCNNGRRKNFVVNDNDEFIVRMQKRKLHVSSKI